jgi:hypothetical protein
VKPFGVPLLRSLAASGLLLSCDLLLRVRPYWDTEETGTPQKLARFFCLSRFSYS